MKPTFLDYDQARAWMEQKAKEHGGLKAFSATSEYKQVYPEIEAIYKKETLAASTKALQKAGLEYGEEVTYSQLNLLLGGVITAKGKLVERRGKPYVKLDPPVLGRKEVRWHSGFVRVAYSYDRGGT